MYISRYNGTVVGDEDGKNYNNTTSMRHGTCMRPHEMGLMIRHDVLGRSGLWQKPADRISH